MNSVLVFTGRSAVDGEDFRWQLLRVPEVSNVLKEAQQILDVCVKDSKDIVALMQSENKDYLSSGLWRALTSQLVQIGLYRRYQKIYSSPRFLVGELSGTSAFSVCIGKSSIEEAIISFGDELNRNEEQLKNKDFLIGHTLESAMACERVNNTYQVLFEGKQIVELLENINKDILVGQVVTLGSASFLSSTESLAELGIVQSVVMDPLLSWLLPFVGVA